MTKPSQHVLERILAHPFARRTLKWMTAVEGNRDCFFERLCRSYNNPALGRTDRWKWLLPELLIDLGLHKAGAR